MANEASALAMKLLMDGDSQGAIVEWKKAVESIEQAGAAPTEEAAKIYYYLGKTQLDERILDEAISHLTEAKRLFVATNPQHPDLQPTILSLHNALRLAGRLPEPEKTRYATFKKGLKALKKIGRLQELKPKEIKGIFEECGWDYESEVDEEGKETLVSFLIAYYCRHVDLRVKDGFLSCDWRYGQETDDAPAEFASLLGDAIPLFKQVSINIDYSTSMVRDNGEEFTLTFDGLHEIANLFNEGLKARGDERRFVPLETGGDCHAYLLLKQEEFKALFQGKEIVLPLEIDSGFEDFNWR